MSLAERILLVVENQANGDRKLFSKQTGIPYSTLTEYCNGTKTDPKMSFLSRFKNVNTYWLMTGEGEPFKLNSEIIEINPDSKTNTIIADVKASAGFGQIMSNQAALDQLPGMFIPNAPLGMNVAFQIKGDSMEPTVNQYDYVAGNLVDDARRLKDGLVYLIIDKYDGVMCKRLYDDGDQYILKSDNRFYEDYHRDKSDILAIYEAFAKLSTNFKAPDPKEWQSNADSLWEEIREIKKQLSNLK